MAEAIAAGWEMLSRGAWDEALALVDGVAAARTDEAIDASVELDRLAGEIGTTVVRAAAARAGGESAVATGDLELARRRLEDAVDLYGLCEAPYERARARLVLAHVLLELGADDRARTERPRRAPRSSSSARAATRRLPRGFSTRGSPAP